jgi:hypothetical protein
MQFVPRLASSVKWEQMGASVAPGIRHPIAVARTKEFVSYALVYFHTFGIRLHPRIFVLLRTVIRIR